MDDDKRCAAKYGKLWHEYLKKVPSRIIPKVSCCRKLPSDISATIPVLSEASFRHICNNIPVL
ncbi:MAG: hypothetical protein H6579_06675 [Chitinophagales bacterium]|nr:hypothetical protein [Chitinophagales bacterium]